MMGKLAGCPYHPINGSDWWTDERLSAHRGASEKRLKPSICTSLSHFFLADLDPSQLGLLLPVNQEDRIVSLVPQFVEERHYGNSHRVGDRFHRNACTTYHAWDQAACHLAQSGAPRSGLPGWMIRKKGTPGPAARCPFGIASSLGAHLHLGFPVLRRRNRDSLSGNNGWLCRHRESRRNHSWPTITAATAGEII